MSLRNPTPVGGEPAAKLTAHKHLILAHESYCRCMNLLPNRTRRVCRYLIPRSLFKCSISAWACAAGM
jgi:hypothetical protein